MKTAFSTLAFFLLASPVVASDAYDYSFPGCNPGSGSWPARNMQIPHSVCDVPPDVTPSYSEGGHCNGWLQLAPVCKDGRVTSVEVMDCFCD